ncbi:HAD family hydrolase [Chloroflexota bacterium]
MYFSAVIFDLFGTIVRDIAGPPYDHAVRRMASVLSVDYEDFSRLWFGTVYERNTGHFLTLHDNVKYICQQFGVLVNEERLSAAVEIRHNLARQSMMLPRAGSLDTLRQLRRGKYKIGLISDCSPSEPEIWPDTPFEALFDVTVFSCLVNLKKPDPEIYQLAASQLNVKCTDCLYVGNGGSNELSGAFAAAMYPVLILPEKDAEPYLPADKNVIDFALQHGTVISSIDEVLTLV